MPLKGCRSPRHIAVARCLSIRSFEYDLASTPNATLDSAALVSALSKDSRYRAAESTSGTTNDVFRKVYSPKNRADGSANEGGEAGSCRDEQNEMVKIVRDVHLNLMLHVLRIRCCESLYIYI